MSSPSVVRVARPEDYDEVWRLLMESHMENALFTLAPDKVKWHLNRTLFSDAIPVDDPGFRGVIGVIGTIGELEGLVFIGIDSYWYTYDKNLSEYMVYVSPRHRRSGHAKALVSWMKEQPNKTGLPLVTGILSTIRTEAKCRLYQRLMPKIGEFFLVTPNGDISNVPALSAVSS